jgi:hypothetical protein
MRRKGLDFQDFVRNARPSREEEGIQGVLTGDHRVHEDASSTAPVLINIAA